MKKLLVSIVTVVALTLGVTGVAFAKGGGSVYVHGHTTKNGTYVAPHYRSAPDGNPYNNWSFPGNTNPYTGKTASGNPTTYLNNYYNKNSGSLYTPPTTNYVPLYLGNTTNNGLVTCGKGYKLNYQSNSCDPVIVPSNASLDYFGSDFLCNRGFKRNYTTNQCDAVMLPPNSTLDYFGSDFICDRGFKRNYVTNRCDAVQIPLNATLDYFGSDFICNRGFERNYSTNQCNAVIIPPNAQLDYFGSDFVCNTGYTRNYVTNTCN